MCLCTYLYLLCVDRVCISRFSKTFLRLIFKWMAYTRTTTKFCCKPKTLDKNDWMHMIVFDEQNVHYHSHLIMYFMWGRREYPWCPLVGHSDIVWLISLLKIVGIKKDNKMAGIIFHRPHLWGGRNRDEKKGEYEIWSTLKHIFHSRLLLLLLVIGIINSTIPVNLYILIDFFFLCIYISRFYSL